MRTEAARCDEMEGNANAQVHGKDPGRNGRARRQSPVLESVDEDQKKCGIYPVQGCRKTGKGLPHQRQPLPGINYLQKIFTCG